MMIFCRKSLCDIFAVSFENAAMHALHYFEKNSYDFKFGQKVCPNIKPVETFIVRNIYSTV